MNRPLRHLLLVLAAALAAGYTVAALAQGEVLDPMAAQWLADLLANGGPPAVVVVGGVFWLDRRLRGLDAGVGDLSSRLAAVEGGMAAMAKRQHEIERRLSDAKDDLQDSVTTTRHGLKNDLQRVWGDVAAANTSLAAMDARLTAVEEMARGAQVQARDALRLSLDGLSRPRRASDPHPYGEGEV